MASLMLIEHFGMFACMLAAMPSPRNVAEHT
jgi:hypothetical protein